jgi:preprotein translocase subunit SecA
MMSTTKYPETLPEVSSQETETPIRRIHVANANFILRRFLSSTGNKVEEFINFHRHTPVDLLKEKFWSPGVTMPEAFALGYWAMAHSMGIKLHSNQLAAGLLMGRSSLIELATGEGKTFAAALPVAWWARHAPKGTVHVATANDYLAERDAELLSPLYSSLGLTCKHRNKDKETLDAYQASIVYSTAQQLGFDFLTDRLAKDANDIKQPGFYGIVVDEADALLIDEARNPLILSGPGGSLGYNWYLGTTWAATLKEGLEYLIDYERKEIILTELGAKSAEAFFHVENLYEHANIANLAYISAKALALYKNGRDYLVDNQEVVLIDPGTGRPLPSRRVQDGIHEALEAHEGLSGDTSTFTYTSVTLPVFFQRYKYFSGMSGTLMDNASELISTYKVPVVSVPTHNPLIRTDKEDLIFATKEQRLLVLIDILKDAQSRRQPVLIGTVSVDASEETAAALSKHNIPHTILNARSLSQEAAIIAKAGLPGQITISTDLAGRGVDIKLGGPDQKYEKEVLEAGGLLVVGLGRHDSRRVDNQLRGRAGRQGAPGVSQFLLALDDDLLKNFGGETTFSFFSRLGSLEKGLSGPGVNNFVAACQAKVEGFLREARDSLRKYDEVISAQRESYWSFRNHVLSYDFQELATLWYSTLMALEKTTSIEEYDSIWPFRDQNLNLETWTENIRRHWEGFEDPVRKMALTHIMLQSTDQAWAFHLRDLESLKSAVSLRSYANIDPLTSFSLDSSDLWDESFRAAIKEATGVIWNLKLANIPDLEK